MPKMVKKLPYNLHGSIFYKIVKFILRKKFYQYITTISITKNWSDLKVKWTRISTHKLQGQFFTQREGARSRSQQQKKQTYQNAWEKTQVRPLFTP